LEQELDFGDFHLDLPAILPDTAPPFRNNEANFENMAPEHADSPLKTPKLLPMEHVAFIDLYFQADLLEFHRSFSEQDDLFMAGTLDLELELAMVHAKTPRIDKPDELTAAYHDRPTFDLRHLPIDLYRAQNYLDAQDGWFIENEPSGWYSVHDTKKDLKDLIKSLDRLSGSNLALTKERRRYIDNKIWELRNALEQSVRTLRGTEGANSALNTSVTSLSKEALSNTGLVRLPRAGLQLQEYADGLTVPKSSPPELIV